MANVIAQHHPLHDATYLSETVHNPVYEARLVLWIAYVAAPLIAGADKFFYALVDWSQYLAPRVAQITGYHPFMQVVGVIEMVAGLIVLLNPRVGGYIVGFWLLGIVVNLLIFPGYFDIALRDFGLAMGAFALAWLSKSIEQEAPASAKTVS